MMVMIVCIALSFACFCFSGVRPVLGYAVTGRGTMGRSAKILGHP
jgi:hypothetical protein